MATTATLGATSLEGQLLEVCREMQQAEEAFVAAGQALTPPVQRQRRVTVTPNLSAGTVTIAATIPITSTDAPNGYSIVATPYLP